MQKLTPLALVLGALIVAAALVYHGRQLSDTTVRLEALQKELATVDSGLESLQANLPTIIEQAGRGVGREAVQGAMDEAFSKPLQKLTTLLAPASTNGPGGGPTPADIARLLADRTAPILQWDILEPVVNIDILPNLKDLPDGSWWSGLAGELIDQLPAGAARDALPDGAPPGLARVREGMTVEAFEAALGAAGVPRPNPDPTWSTRDYDFNGFAIVARIRAGDGADGGQVEEYTVVRDDLTAGERQRRRNEAWHEWVRQRAGQADAVPAPRSGDTP